MQEIESHQKWVSKTQIQEQRSKATWDDTSESERDEEQDEVVNFFFMALEDDIEVPSTSYSSLNNDCDDYCNDDDDGDETSIVSKLMLKCKSLLSKKKHYKHELISLNKVLTLWVNQSGFWS